MTPSSPPLEEDPDDTLALLADLTGATDPKLRSLARRLAGRLFLDLFTPAGRAVPSRRRTAPDPAVPT